MRKLRSYSLYGLIGKIEQPNRTICRTIMREHRQLFEAACGGRKHHPWPGGYIDHLTEAMNFGFQAYNLEAGTGRMELLPKEWQYNLSDVMLVLFLHDLEKPWKYCPEAWFLETPMGPAETKAERSDIRTRLMEHYGFKLAPRHLRALQLVEGLRDSAYSAHTQLMWPLALTCHYADYRSAIYGSIFPLATDDPFIGARRITRD